MGFKKEHSKYELYDDSQFYMKTIPNGLTDAVNGLIAKHCKSDPQLVRAINAILAAIPAGPTTHWGGNFLVEELENALWNLSRAKFHKFMDGIMASVETIRDDEYVEDLNEVFEEMDFGYTISYDAIFGYEWEMREQQDDVTESVTLTETEIKDICQQARNHLEQCKRNMQTDTDRARKDAVRDVMSAMEALLKELTQTVDIKDATTALRADGTWGEDLVVKDGLSIWNHLHKLYPDVRHGNPKISEMDKEEAYYWIERITCFVNYLSRRKKAMED